MNVGRMDLAVIQYFRVRVGEPNDNAWSMLVSESNAFSGVRLIGMVG